MTSSMVTGCKFTFPDTPPQPVTHMITMQSVCSHTMYRFRHDISNVTLPRNKFNGDNPFLPHRPHVEICSQSAPSRSQSLPVTSSPLPVTPSRSQSLPVRSQSAPSCSQSAPSHSQSTPSRSQSAPSLNGKKFRRN